MIDAQFVAGSLICIETATKLVRLTADRDFDRWDIVGNAVWAKPWIAATRAFEMRYRGLLSSAADDLLTFSIPPELHHPGFLSKRSIHCHSAHAAIGAIGDLVTTALHRHCQKNLPFLDVESIRAFLEGAGTRVDMSTREQIRWPRRVVFQYAWHPGPDASSDERPYFLDPDSFGRTFFHPDDLEGVEIEVFDTAVDVPGFGPLRKSRFYGYEDDGDAAGWIDQYLAVADLELLKTKAERELYLLLARHLQNPRDTERLLCEADDLVSQTQPFGCSLIGRFYYDADSPASQNDRRADGTFDPDDWSNAWKDPDDELPPGFSPDRKVVGTLEEICRWFGWAFRDDIYKRQLLQLCRQKRVYLACKQPLRSRERIVYLRTESFFETVESRRQADLSQRKQTNGDDSRPG